MTGMRFLAEPRPEDGAGDGAEIAGFVGDLVSFWSVDIAAEDTKLPVAEEESNCTDGAFNARGAYVIGGGGEGVCVAFLPLAMYILSLKTSCAGTIRRNPSFVKLLWTHGPATNNEVFCSTRGSPWNLSRKAT